MPINKDKKIIFVHIPKTGGLAIKEFIGATNISKSGYGHLKIKDVKKKLGTIDDYYIFTIVRNPWDRLVSAYFCNFCQKTEGYRKNIGFKKFIIEKKYQMENGEKLRISIKPQYLWLINNSRDIVVPNIFKYEELSQAESVLKNRFNLKGKLKQINKSKARIFRDYRAYYDEETVHIVESMYTEDIKRFNYTF